MERCYSEKSFQNNERGLSYPEPYLSKQMYLEPLSWK